MTLSVKTRIVRALQSGKSLRQIAAVTGVGDVQGKAIYRIGAAEGVYSVRSARNTTKRPAQKSGRKS